MNARILFWTAGAELALGVLALSLGFTPLAMTLGLASGLLTTVACIQQVIANHRERKINGRHREASEAHRAGTGRSAGHSSHSGGDAGGGAGAGMSGFYSLGAHISYARAQEEAARKMLAGTLTGTPAVFNQKQPRAAGEFDGKTSDFAAGVVTGTRSFDVDKLGRLTGVSFAAIWTPGENVARCMQRQNPFTFYDPMDEPRLRESNKPPHSIADCGHGFYGYYEGSNDYYEPGRVMGVVEAYGETIVGSRGFRASKARIVALHIPDEISYGKRRQIARNYAGIPTFDSFDAMVAEFPPDDAGHGIGPDTDPDFWTREA